MAMRIRTIKPEFWRNRKLASLGREVHDLAARLITACDDAGFCEADPALLAGDLYPFDSDAQRFIKKSLPDLERIGFIIVRGGEHGILCLPKFLEHQRINRPSPSRLKARFEQMVAISQFSEPSWSPHGALSEPSSTEVEREVEREQGSGKGTGSVPRAALGPTPEDLAVLWNSVTTPPLPKVDAPEKLGKARRDAFDAALKRRGLPDWRRVFEIVNASSYCRGAKGWIADIDWATRAEGKKPEPATKILEGSFADTGPPAQKRLTGLEGSGPLTATEGTL